MLLHELFKTHTLCLEFSDCGKLLVTKSVAQGTLAKRGQCGNRTVATAETSQPDSAGSTPGGCTGPVTSLLQWQPGAGNGGTMTWGNLSSPLEKWPASLDAHQALHFQNPLQQQLSSPLTRKFSKEKLDWGRRWRPHSPSHCYTSSCLVCEMKSPSKILSDSKILWLMALSFPPETHCVPSGLLACAAPPKAHSWAAIPPILACYLHSAPRPFLGSEP